MEKKKRGRPKKIELPEEVQEVLDIIKETKQKEENEFH